MITEAKYVMMDQLEAGLESIRQTPTDAGAVRLIVRRPSEGERQVLQEGQLDLVQGLVGDGWKQRGSSRTPDGSAHPEMQITIMNARVIALLAPDQERWPLAGDQLFVDLDLSSQNLPPGARLAVGSAVLEVTAPPHTGCKKFAARFGTEALKFISTPEGRSRQMRGIHAKVVQPGTVRVGDVARKI
jgi:MOSC domain-containing protein YiiM